MVAQGLREEIRSPTSKESAWNGGRARGPTQQWLLSLPEAQGEGSTQGEGMTEEVLTVNELERF